MLEKAGGHRGKVSRPANRSSPGQPPLAVVDSLKTGELIWAASMGDLEAIRRLVAQGVPLEAADYDHRTAMHLAAAEGHLQPVQFFLAHGTRINPEDRWGNTPLDEAIRHDQEVIAEVLAGHGGRERRRGRETESRSLEAKVA